MRCRKCAIGTAIYILVLLLLAFNLVFVIVPMAFKYSVGVQKSLIFPTDLIEPHKNYSDIQSYGITGVRNFYINVDEDNKDPENITLGVWQILPEEMISELIRNDEYNFEGALSNAKYDILLFLHGNGSDRTMRIKFYELLRQFFHIFAVDYRGYADSTKSDINESLIVKDLLQVFKWIKSKSKSKVFIWGHSLGTGVGTRLISDLKTENFTLLPSGLILEAPFTSVTDVMKLHPIIQFYSYMPWCKATMLDPIVENGLDFNNKAYIKKVDCPVMILHAKDDGIIPYHMAVELYNIAIQHRTVTRGSNVTLHLYDETEGYGHMNIPEAPELARHVNEFVQLCHKYEDTKHQPRS